MQAAAGVARAAGQATAREISQAFRTVQNEQRIAIEQARQTTVAVRAQQTQISATTRAESQERIQAARAESVAQQQAARAATATAIEEERRKTAAFRQEIRERNRAQIGFGQNAATFAGAAFGGPIGGLAGAVAGGSPYLAAGLALGEGARYTIEATRLATAYDRQRVAAVNLAGSQARLNQLLAVYDRATGGAIDKGTELAKVTQLISVGFADNAQELDRFARAIRGISIAMDTSQDTVTQNLVLELFSQRGQRLDQLGLQYDKVRKRADELRAADASLTQQQAYQNAVLDQANERYGKLADSTEGSASGLERLGREWKNFRLQVGQDNQEIVDETANWFATLVQVVNINRELNQIAKERVEWLKQGLNISTMEFVQASAARDQARHAAAGRSRGPTPLSDEQVAALRRRDEGFEEISRSTRLALDEERSSFTRQRGNLESNYQKQSIREAEDFARQRLYAERKLQMSILDVAQDSARQRVKWEQDAARAIAEARAERDERIAELRADSAERIGEIEEKFAKDQEKRARDHAERLRDAAANLDAVAIREEQRRYREQNQEAKDAHDEQISDAQEALQEGIDEQNKAFAKQEQQQRESLQRRLDEQKENDRLRIDEMKAAFEAQKAQEDEERAIRLDRQAEDHNDQLGELDRQHGERIQQIQDHAQQEREQFTEESNRFLEEVGIHNQAWLDEQEALNNGVIQRHQALLEAQRRALELSNQPYVDRAFPQLYTTPSPTPAAPSGPPFTPLAPYKPSTTIQGGLNVTLVGTGVQQNEEGRNWIIGVFTDLIEEYWP